MENSAKMAKLRYMGYKQILVKGQDWNYYLFVNKAYVERLDRYTKQYPYWSAIWKHHADFIFDIKTLKWTKERFEILLTKADKVLYGS